MAWFHCFAGVAGDMVLGALVDAGAPLDGIREVLAALSLPGWGIRAEPVERGGIGATRVVVEVDDDRRARRYPELAGLVADAALPPPVAERSLAVLRALAEAEAAVHRTTVADVHLHELGGHDTVIDVVGAAAALDLLGVDAVEASPVAVGTGVVRTAHGLLPNPSPAVVTLLRGAPVVGRDTPLELTTPTGAALLATWARRFGPVPALRVQASGYGAGTADPAAAPNCLQVVVGDQVGAPGDEAGMPLGAGADHAEPVVLLETTVDDVTGETLGHTLGALLEAGALDAWVAPVVMKQGRPGHVVTALADPAAVAAVHQVLRRETGTLGVRVAGVQRWVAPRRLEEVEVAGQLVQVKVSPGRVKAEHRDVARAAAVLGWPVRQVAAAAESAWCRTRADHPEAPAPDGCS